MSKRQIRDLQTCSDAEAAAARCSRLAADESVRAAGLVGRGRRGQREAPSTRRGSLSSRSTVPVDLFVISCTQVQMRAISSSREKFDSERSSITQELRGGRGGTRLPDLRALPPTPPPLYTMSLPIYLGPPPSPAPRPRLLTPRRRHRRPRPPPPLRAAPGARLHARQPCAPLGGKSAQPRG